MNYIYYSNFLSSLFLSSAVIFFFVFFFFLLFVTCFKCCKNIFRTF